MTKFLATLLLICSAHSVLIAETIYVSPQGEHDSIGTRDQPLKTISAAAKRAMPGDAVYVLEGVYRERVAPPRSGEPNKPIVFRAEPGKRVFIRGSEIWSPEWREEGGGVYSARPDESLFDDRSPEYLDHHNPLKVELASTPWRRQGRREAERKAAGDARIGKTDPRIVYTCGQVFVNSKQYKEVPLRDEFAPETWWYEPKSERVYVHFADANPQEQTVELTTRRRLFAPKKRELGHIVVEGFIFEHCGNQYPTNFWDTDENAQKGAVGTEAGHHWTIRRNVVRHCKTFAIDVGRVDRHSSSASSSDNLVEENYIVENGSAGILSNGSVRLILRNNVILRNNTLQFFGIKRWEQAGIKTHQFKDGLIERNYIAHNRDMSGIWLDNQFPDSRVNRNVVYDNGTRGLFLEMSDYDFDRLLVDHNIFLANHENAVYIHDASGATFAHNLLANTPEKPGYGQAIYIRQVSPRTKTYHHSFYNNLVVDNARLLDVNYPAVRSGPQRFDGNLYGEAEDAREFVINDKSDSPSPWSEEEFRDLIVSDLGFSVPRQGMFTEPGRAALSASEWYQFWRNIGVENDVHSSFDLRAQVDYEPASQILTVEIHIDPLGKGIDPPASVRHDYFGKPVARSEMPTPGPFGELQTGRNQFKIWEGLPILGEGELPLPEWTDTGRISRTLAQ